MKYNFNEDGTVKEVVIPTYDDGRIKIGNFRKDTLFETDVYALQELDRYINTQLAVILKHHGLDGILNWEKHTDVNFPAFLRVQDVNYLAGYCRGNVEELYKLRDIFGDIANSYDIKNLENVEWVQGLKNKFYTFASMIDAHIRLIGDD